MIKKLKYNFISGIIWGIILMPLMILSLLKGFHKLPISLSSLYIILTTVAFITSSYFLFGFILIGKKMKNKLIVYSIYILIISNVVSFLHIIVFDYITKVVNLVVSGLVLIITGIGLIIFGIAINKLLTIFGKVIKVTRILSISAGICFCTIIFAIIGSLISIVLTIFQILIMFRAYKNLK